jgi:mRNA interferase RelE/StbE
VTYAVVWEPTAVDLDTRFLADDPEGLQAVFDAVDALAEDPRPGTAFPLGSSGLHRLRAGRCRAVYEIDENARAVRVRHLGRRP